MVSLDREAQCPSCGAGVTFKFAGARSVVCDFCSSIVARTNAGVAATGRMADVLEIPAPLPYEATGKWNGAFMEVLSFVQMDRAGAPGAPWQEMLVWFPERDTTTWVAYAQGKWYATTEVPEPPPLPPIDSLRPGGQVDLGQHGLYVVQEVAQRRVMSGKGSMPNVPAPGVITRYADISGPQGAFGTIDFGDGSAAPVLFLGRIFDPTEIQLDSGMPVEAPEAEAKVHECPNCGAGLPQISGQAQRIVCQYCKTASDVQAQGLQALGPAPPPPVEPYIPIGSKGTFRGHEYIVAGFVVRSCNVDGINYPWREYLLFGGEKVGYRWLMEEDGNWSFVEPVETGDVVDSGNSAMLNGAQYGFKQQVQAVVDFVIGEFYWKVEVGEAVEATEFEGPGGKVSREKSATEVTYTFVSPAQPNEIAAFGVPPPGGGYNMAGGGYQPMPMGASTAGSQGGGCGQVATTLLVIIFICFILTLMLGGGCGGGGGRSYGGGSSWGK